MFFLEIVFLFSDRIILPSTLTTLHFFPKYSQTLDITKRRNVCSQVLTNESCYYRISYSAHLFYCNMKKI